MLCEIHGTRTEYVCRVCGRELCERCTKLVATGPSAVRVCPKCGGYVEPRNEPRNISERSYWTTLATAVVWPLSLRGLVVVVINALFVSVLVAMASLAGFFIVGAVLAILVLLFAYGYLFLLFLSVVQKTAFGEAETPATPDVNGPGEAFVALFRVLVVLLVWATPAIITYWAAGERITPAFWVAAAAGGFLLPMSLLAVAMFGSLRGVNPVPLLTAIMRVPGQYLACCVFFFMVIAARDAFIDLVSTAQLGFLGILITHVVMVYSLFVAGRLLGGLHAANSLRFGWVRA